MNFDQARREMVSRQIAARGVRDQRVLAALEQVPRHLFLSEIQQAAAYGDHPLPIGEGQTISQPFMVASMTEALGLTGSEKILEIGTGSGYQAAVLAVLARQVVSIERILSLAEKARARLKSLPADNVVVHVGDGTLGWPDSGPYQGIMVTAGAPATPKPLLAQLDIGGRLVIPVGSRSSQVIEIHTKTGIDSYSIRKDTACRFVDLIGRHGWEC